MKFARTVFGAAVWLLASAAAAQAPSPPAGPPSAPAPDPSNGAHRIVGGYPVEAGEARWQVEIVDSPIYQRTEDGHVEGQRKFTPANLRNGPLWSWEHYCGGSLIAPGWVLTAAHCVSAVDLKKGLRVRLGDVDISQPGWVYAMDRVYVHPLYKLGGDTAPPRNDIALVHLAATPLRPPVVDTAPPAGQPPAIAIALEGFAANVPATTSGDWVFVTGWGRATTQDFNMGKADPQLVPPFQQVLQEVGLSLISASACAAALRTPIGADMVCATATGKDSCNGDSGGPMRRLVPDPGHRRDAEGAPLRRDVQVALVSWGATACGSAPGVYTRISAYKDWIVQTMGRDATLLLR